MSGDDPRRAEDEEAGGPDGEQGPWGGSRPWWTVEPGTGPQILPGGSGQFQVVPDGTGPQIVINGGTGGHPIVGNATGGHPVVADGSGAFPALPNGTGPLPPMPGPAAGRRRGPRLLLALGGLLVAGVVVVAGVLAVRSDGGGGQNARVAGLPASKRVIEAGGTAGGLHRDGLVGPPASAAYPFVAGAVEAGGVPAAKRGQAVYSEEPVRPVNVLFVGGTGRVGNPADFLQKAQPTTFIAGQDAEPGPMGGRAVCGTFAVLAQTHTYCAWATVDSYGIVASNVPSANPEFTLMADVMRRIRKDVERRR
ncbi:hypothetical protein ACFOY4_05295 [Actinomadura syzygii]|uniref:hypothetical protein n=1 Tax=Actinomadura syzygii TaxID=1427538 RepID=UPI00361806AB